MKTEKQSESKLRRCARTAPARARSGVRAALGCATVVVSSALFTSPACAQIPVIDVDLVRILGELKFAQSAEFSMNVARWEEVSELLRKYVEYSRAEETRHGQWKQNNTLLDQAKKDDFANTFRGLTSSLRQVKGTDLSSKALASGLQQPAGSGGGGGVGGLGTLGGAGRGRGRHRERGSRIPAIDFRVAG
jgi:hypothetical protein